MAGLEGPSGGGCNALGQQGGKESGVVASTAHGTLNVDCIQLVMEFLLGDAFSTLRARGVSRALEQAVTDALIYHIKSSLPFTTGRMAKRLLTLAFMLQPDIVSEASQYVVRYAVIRASGWHAVENRMAVNPKKSYTEATVELRTSQPDPSVICLGRFSSLETDDFFPSKPNRKKKTKKRR